MTLGRIRMSQKERYRMLVVAGALAGITASVAGRGIFTALGLATVVYVVVKLTTVVDGR